jgi:hypothetical protein
MRIDACYLHQLLSPTLGQKTSYTTAQLLFLSTSHLGTDDLWLLVDGNGYKRLSEQEIEKQPFGEELRSPRGTYVMAMVKERPA